MLEVLGAVEAEFGSGDSGNREKLFVPVNTLKEFADLCCGLPHFGMTEQSVTF